MLKLADAYRRLGVLPRSPFTVEDYRAHLFAQYRAYEITYEIRDVMPRGAAAFADWDRNHVVIPLPDNEVRIAIGFHEGGHLIAGRCCGPLHQPDRSVRDWHHCTECELEACSCAVLLLAPLPLTKVMHDEFSRGLRFHRANTPPPEVIARLDRFMSDLRFRELKAREREHGVRDSAVRIADAAAWLNTIS